MGVGYTPGGTDGAHDSSCAVTETNAVADAITAYRSALTSATVGGTVAPELGPPILAAESAVDVAEANMWAAQEACGIGTTASFWSTEPRYSQSSSQGHLVIRRVATDGSEILLGHANIDPHPDHTVWYNPGTLVSGGGYRRFLHNVHTTDADSTTWVLSSQSTWTVSRIFKFHVDRDRYATIKMAGSGAPGKAPSSGGGGGGGELVTFSLILKPNIEYSVQVSKPYHPDINPFSAERGELVSGFDFVDPTDNTHYYVKAYPGGTHTETSLLPYGSGAGGDGYKTDYTSGQEEAGQDVVTDVENRNSYSYADGSSTSTDGLPLTSVQKNSGGNGVWLSSTSLGGGGGGALTSGRAADDSTNPAKGGDGVTYTVPGTTHEYYLCAGGGGGGYTLRGFSGDFGGGNGGKTSVSVTPGDGDSIFHAYGCGGGGSAFDDNVGGNGGGGICIIELGNEVVPDGTEMF